MKAILLQHGEKIVLLVVLIICGLWIKAVVDDPKTMPKKGADKVSIDKNLKLITTSLAQTPPNPKQPPDYTADIQNRLSVEVESADTLQWLTAHPDIVEGSTGKKNVFSIYEVLQPEVSATDEVGSVLVQVSLPRDLKSKDEVKTGSDVIWERETPSGETVTNSGRWLAVKVEFRSGEKGEWRPLRTAGPDGVYIFRNEEYTTPDFRHNGVQGKQHYSYRAALIVAATGIREEGIQELGEEIIVYDGQFKGNVDRSAWLKNPKIPGRLKPMDPTKLPKSIKLAKTEKAYFGSFGQEAVIPQTESDMIMAVKQVSSLGGPPTLRLWIKKMVRNHKGDILGWTKATEFKNIKVGDKLGDEKKHVLIDGRETVGKIAVDFSNDWKLVSMDTQARRIYYYEVKVASDTEGNKDLYPDGKKLVIKEKARTNYHTITIDNGVEKVQMIKLDKISIPERIMKFVVPLLPDNNEKFDEVDAFVNGDPLEFTQPILVPEPPILRQPDEEPNVDTSIDDKPFQTNIPYYEFPDNRVIFYDHVNKELRILGKEPEAPVEEPELPEGQEGMEGEEGPEGGEEQPPE